MNQKVAFLTTIFPMKKEYLYDFFHSLQDQTFQKFDLIVVNDGNQEFKELIKEFPTLNIIELEAIGTPAKNRELGINYAIKMQYDSLIFGDSDDCFSKNRIEHVIGLLEKHEIVVNDFTSFYENKILDEKYLSNRLENNQEIKLELILDKNILGLSTTAINLKNLEKVVLDNELVAVDWYLFTLLLEQGFKAVFTNEVVTYYRQHENNIVGINKDYNKTILNTLNVKKIHYKILKKRYNSFNKLYEQTIQDEKLVKQNELEVKIDENKQFLFWWEETNYLEGKK